MTKSEEATLRSSLTKAIQQWWNEGEAYDVLSESPVLGENTHALMAEAALSVLHGIQDAQAEAISEGYLVPSESY